jgi:hypothetical protein
MIPPAALTAVGFGVAHEEVMWTGESLNLTDTGIGVNSPLVTYPKEVKGV